MKASVIVLVALAATALMRNRSAAVRHWVLSAAIVCAAVTPALELIVPSWHVAFGRSALIPAAAPLNESAAVAPALPRETSPATSRQPSVDHQQTLSRDTAAITVAGALAAIWIAGIAVSVSLLVIGLGRLAWLASRSRRIIAGPWITVLDDVARRYGIGRAVRLLQSDHPTLLVTWGLLQPKVILPRAAYGWPEDRIRVVLAHELAHVARRDWLTQMTAELLRSVYWFNPFLWVACRRLRQDSEQACDDAVLNLGVDGPDYAGHLLDLARDVTRYRTRWSGFPAPAIARPSSLERRVTAMLNARLNRRPLTRSARFVAAVSLLAVTIPIAGFGQSFVTLSGSVVDPSGRIVPGVTLVLSNSQRQEKREVRSDAAGRFEFAGVPAGDYVLSTEFMGFKPLRENLTLGGKNVERNLSMEIGSLQETITVVSGPASPPRSPSDRRSGPQWPEYDPCSASPVGGCIKPPTKIVDVRPVYPEQLSDAKVGGVVVMTARLGTDGSIVRVQLADPNDPIDPALVHAARTAISQWQFTPTQLGGVPVETDMKVTVNFVIR
jgi:TonB family protein